MNPFEHNPDLNPNWRPLVAWRVYRCVGCDAETELQTNHTGRVYHARCAGSCKDIIFANTAREKVTWHPDRPHDYVREADR